ncbi:GSCOCG00008686001-RA-CDS, partial [Cotesia congregata]
GKIWKNISKFFCEQTVIPLNLYYDDFEVNDPLSSSAGIHKIVGLYFSIASLPPKFASTVDNIILAQVIYNSDYKEFGAERCFTEINNELNYLATKGITINVNGQNHSIYFVLIGILGDNLALNSLFGYNESFISEYCCRFCRVPKCDAQKLTVENKNLLRTKQNYEEDLLNHSKGVKTSCVFNDIKLFHNTNNWTVDVMHDLLKFFNHSEAAVIKFHQSSEVMFKMNI